MKRHPLLLIISAFIITIAILSSCSKEEEKYYTIYYDIISGYKCDVDMTIYEYNEKGEKINSHIWNNVEGEEEMTFTASSKAVKVKIHLDMVYTKERIKQWVQQVYYLEKNNTDIHITYKTPMADLEP